MPAVILSHRVAEFNAWKEKFDADKGRREEHGMKDLVVGRKSDDPGLVYLVFEVEDVARVDDFIADPATAEIMKEAGVISQPEVITLD